MCKVISTTASTSVGARTLAARRLAQRCFPSVGAGRRKGVGLTVDSGVLRTDRFRLDDLRPIKGRDISHLRVNWSQYFDSSLLCQARSLMTWSSISIPVSSLFDRVFAFS